MLFLSKAEIIPFNLIRVIPALGKFILMNKKLYTSILLCNAIEHFDTALYAFLAPIFARLFFPKYDYVVQLIAAYGVMGASSLIKPIGAYFFTKLAKKKGPLSSLKVSILGVSAATSLIFFIPTYDQIGWIATALLVLCRALMGFFGAGEIAISRVFLIEHDSSYRMSGIYESSTILGIILASGMSMFVFMFEELEIWRVFFILSGMIGIIAFVLRNNEKYDKCFDTKKIKIDKLKVLKIVLNIIVGNITYSIPFVLLNSLMPMIHPEISIVDMMSLNTVLLCLDLIVFFIVGSLNLKFKPKDVIFWSYCILGVLSPIFFMFLEGSTILFVTIGRVVIVVLGVVAAAAQNLYFNQMFQNSNERYSVIGNSIVIGDVLFVKTTPAICLAIFKHTGDPLWIGVYISFFCFLCIYFNSLD